MRFGADLLADPAERIMSRAAAPWGDRQVAVSCPGGRCLVRGLGEAHLPGMRAHFGEFLQGLPSGAAPAAMDVMKAPEGSFLPWRGTERQLVLDVRCGSAEVWVAGIGFLARLELAASERLTVWSLREPTRVFAEMVENALRVMSAYRLLAAGGCLLHGAALVVDGSAHVFVGRSGAGKSTLALLGRDEGGEVVSDDLAAIVPVPGGFEVVTAPFAGELRLVGRPGRRYPLTSVNRLAKGPGHSWRELPTAAAAGAMAACAPFVNVDPHRAPRLLEVVETLAREVATGELTFARRGGVRRVVEGIWRG